MKKEDVLYEAVKHRDIREMLNNSVKNYGERNAFVIKQKNEGEISYKNITYKMLQDDVNYLGTALMELGLHGKRIAIIADNCYEWCLAYVTTLCGLGIAVPLDKSLPNGEIESLLKRSYTDAVVFSKKYADVMKEIKSNDTDIKYFIQMEEDNNTEFLSLYNLINEGKDVFNNGNKTYLETTIDPYAMGIILFTSGTTSISKAVMLSQDNILSNIYSMDLVIKMTKYDRNLAFLPLHHTFGSTGLLLFLSKGTCNYFCDGLKYIQKNIQEYKITVFVCVPLLLEAINKRIMKEIEKQGKKNTVKIGMAVSNFLLKFGIDIRRKLFKDIHEKFGGELRLAVNGAAGLNENVAKNFHSFGIRTIQGYGLTETSPVIAAENDKHIKLGSVGFPMKNVEVKVDEPNEKGIGEIVVKGPNVMLGYFENEEATKEVLVDGWFHTGDLGYIDNTGNLYITGRKKNVVVMKNGKNIYPEELELLIAKLPYVAENMVFGIPTKDDDLDLAVKVVYNKEYVEEIFNNISEDELRKKVWEDIKEINKTMPPYKYIRELILTDEPMIKTTTQKIKRFEEIKNILKERT